MTRLLVALALALVAGIGVAVTGCPSSPGEGEGEGEGEGACFGDQAAQHSVDDCATMPSAACGPESSNTAVHTCRVTALTVRTGLFEAAFDCLAKIPATDCSDLTTPTNACFDGIKACKNPNAESLCTDAANACDDANDPGFPFDTCLSDLIPTNDAFNSAWSDCFNQNPSVPCSDVEDQCYNVATNSLVGG